MFSSCWRTASRPSTMTDGSARSANRLGSCGEKPAHGSWPVRLSDVNVMPLANVIV